MRHKAQSNMRAYKA